MLHGNFAASACSHHERAWGDRETREVYRAFCVGMIFV
jgi:hypothetical protein